MSNATPHLRRAGQRPKPSTETRDTRTAVRMIAGTLGQLSATLEALQAFKGKHGYQALVDALDADQQAELRDVWSVLQAAGAAQTPPLILADLP